MNKLIVNKIKNIKNKNKLFHKIKKNKNKSLYNKTNL